jgi:AcrR family transcriptional regulator
MSTLDISTLSIREKKRAMQKLKILDAFDEKLKEKRLIDISVREIATELEISEMTFFNYFDTKSEVLVYFIELWNLEMQIKIDNLSPRQAIYIIFDETAKMIERNRNLFMEIVAAMALSGVAKKNIEISRAERIIRFGKDVKYDIGGFRELVFPLLSKLKIPEKEQVLIYTMLHNTCFGTPLLMRSNVYKSLRSSYSDQIELVLGKGENG